MDSRHYLKQLFLQALEACSPSRAVEEAMKFDGAALTTGERIFELKDRPLYLFAVGKAAVPMYESAAKILGSRIRKSLVITPDQEGAETCKAGKVIVGAHPVPNEQSLKAGQMAVHFFEKIPEGALLINLISGGTSSLMCLPSEGISMDNLSATFELLNNSGTPIQDMNTVRKHCSQIKGGQLLQYLNPGVTVIDLVISDVPDNDLSDIGSGPTTADPSTFQDTYHILLEYELWDRLPDSVQAHVEKGITGEDMETLKPGEKPVDNHYQYLIGSAHKLAMKISELSAKQEMDIRIADTPFNEDVEEVASFIADRILKLTDNQRKRTTLFIYYGESTVRVTGSGKGGRNQELALRGALKIAGKQNITWLSAGTDGVDGPTDAAGAIVDGATISEAEQKGIDPREYLANNDAYHFHQKMNTLLKTGPTGNNLMDLTLVLVEVP